MNLPVIPLEDYSKSQHYQLIDDPRNHRVRVRVVLFYSFLCSLSSHHGGPTHHHSSHAFLFHDVEMHLGDVILVFVFVDQAARIDWVASLIPPSPSYR